MASISTALSFKYNDRDKFVVDPFIIIISL